MSKPQEVWELYKSLLRSNRYDEWGDLWADDGQFTVVYGKERFGEETHNGRKEIVSFFSGARDKIETTYFENDVVHKIENSDIFYVTFDFNVITTGKYHYKNRIVCQFTLDGQGKIKELIEYADPIARQRFLKELKKGQAAALFAPGLAAQHLRVIDRALNQYDAAGRFIPTSVDEHGRVLNRTLGVINQSRHLYGFVKAYEFTGDSFYLEKAKEMVDAYLERFVNRLANPPYFFEEIVVAPNGTSKPESSEQLTVNFQAYGLAGMVAFYNAIRDPKILDQIHELHDGFVKRFHDPKQGGFFEKVNPTTGENNGLKSFNSTVYVATSYLRELAEVEPDSAKKQRYMDLLEELANLVVDKFVANEMDAGGTGFIRENFNTAWEPQWRDWQKQMVNRKAFTISPVGHNMQVGWFLLEMFEWTNNDKYKVAAVATLRSMLERGFDWKHGGIYDAAKREEPNITVRWMWGKHKAWWQQAETIQALLHADKLGLLDELDTSRGAGREALDKTVAFWDRFQRPEGGTFEQVSEDGVPIPSRLDHATKGSYHEAQVADVAVRAGGVELSRLGVKRPAAVYTEVRAALERKASLTIQPLLTSLAKLGAIDSVDNLGLTISMRAAALGNLEIVEAAHTLGASFEMHNPRTNANLLHYAAQAVSGGADIINWVILEANAHPRLLSERILVQVEDRLEGNGHTVAMEATFNNNASAIKALIDIDASGRKVDLTTPALTGWTPRGFALREGLAFADDLPPAGQTYEEARDATTAFVKQADDDWISKHPGDKAALDLAVELRNYVLQSVARTSIEARLNSALAGGVDVNARYGRLGQPLQNLVVTDPSMYNLQEQQQARYAEIVDLLIQKGADPRIKETGLMQVGGGFREAVLGYRDALARMIESIPEGVQRQEFINEQGIMNGYTRLIDAALRGRTNVIELLFDYSADKSIKGFNGWTAYDAAVTYNNKGTGKKIPDQVLTCLAP